jgi:hypothetical protein
MERKNRECRSVRLEKERIIVKTHRIVMAVEVGRNRVIVERNSERCNAVFNTTTAFYCQRWKMCA